MTDIYLCDVDGTLADHEGIRSPFNEKKVLMDNPLPTCEVIRGLKTVGANIIFFSGRTEYCREDTISWIKTNIGDFQHIDNFPELYMREIGDRRADEIVKEELYNVHIKGKYRVVGVFDDRLKVLRMWWKLGLFTFNCNQGNKEF